MRLRALMFSFRCCFYERIASKQCLCKFVTLFRFLLILQIFCQIFFKVIHWMHRCGMALSAMTYMSLNSVFWVIVLQNIWSNCQRAHNTYSQHVSCAHYFSCCSNWCRLPHTWRLGNTFLWLFCIAFFPNDAI